MVNQQTYTAQDLVAEGREQGRKEEALRIVRIAMTRRFGGLEHTLSLALETLPTAALEEIVFDTSLEKLQARVSQETSWKRGRNPTQTRLSPRGGILG